MFHSKKVYWMYVFTYTRHLFWDRIIFTVSSWMIHTWIYTYYFNHIFFQALTFDDDLGRNTLIKMLWPIFHISPAPHKKRIAHVLYEKLKRINCKVIFKEGSKTLALHEEVVPHTVHDFHFKISLRIMWNSDMRKIFTGNPMF